MTSGRIDATFQDEIAGSEGFLKQSVGKGYSFDGPAAKDDKFFGVGTSMGLRKDKTDLKAALNKAIAEMRKDGTYEKYAKQYFDFDIFGWDQIDIDPMSASIITLGFIYGAYFTETFRVAFLAVLRRQIEAATESGFSDI